MSHVGKLQPCVYFVMTEVRYPRTSEISWTGTSSTKKNAVMIMYLSLNFWNTDFRLATNFEMQNIFRDVSSCSIFEGCHNPSGATGNQQLHDFSGSVQMPPRTLALELLLCTLCPAKNKIRLQYSYESGHKLVAVCCSDIIWMRWFLKWVQTCPVPYL